MQPEVHDVHEIPQNDVVELSVVESKEESRSRDGVSLTYVPSTAVVRSNDSNYKLLLLTMSHMLLSSEVDEFKAWARDVFSVDISFGVNEGLLELDRKGIISVSDLTNLRSFFEKLLRIDLVHLIDCFLQGDCTFLQQYTSSRNNNLSSKTDTTGEKATPTANASPPTFEEIELFTITGGIARYKCGKLIKGGLTVSKRAADKTFQMRNNAPVFCNSIEIYIQTAIEMIVNSDLNSD